MRTSTKQAQFTEMGRSLELSGVEKVLIAKGKVDEPCWTRTNDPLLKRQMLYQPELTALITWG